MRKHVREEREKVNHKQERPREHSAKSFNHKQERPREQRADAFLLTSSPQTIASSNANTSGLLASFLVKVERDVLVAMPTAQPPVFTYSSNRNAPGISFASAHLQRMPVRITDVRWHMPPTSIVSQ